MQRTPIIAGNWKMNHTSAEALEFINALKEQVLPSYREVIICPPATSLGVFQQELSDSPIKYGAQNMYWEASGAFTGEVSAAMLNDLGCSYVIIGHSERRAYFNETDETVNKKVKAALAADIVPILCVGENLDIRKEGNAIQHVETQVKAALDGVDQDDYKTIVLAYEPIWAIGTGETATPDQAQEVHATIRAIVGEDARILYGGSVKPANCVELMGQQDIDGALVGGASLEVDSFIQIINY